MLVITNSLAPFGELEDARVLDYLFIWNSGSAPVGVWDYGFAIVTAPKEPLGVYRDAIRKGDFSVFASHGAVKGHDRTLPVWALVARITSELDMNEPKLQWHLARKGMYP